MYGYIWHGILRMPPVCKEEEALGGWLRRPDRAMRACRPFLAVACTLHAARCALHVARCASHARRAVARAFGCLAAAGLTTLAFGGGFGADRFTAGGGFAAAGGFAAGLPAGRPARGAASAAGAAPRAVSHAAPG